MSDKINFRTTKDDDTECDSPSTGKDFELHHHDRSPSFSGNITPSVNLYYNKPKEICRLNSDGTFNINDGLSVEDYKKALGDALTELCKYDNPHKETKNSCIQDLYFGPDKDISLSDIQNKVNIGGPTPMANEMRHFKTIEDVYTDVFGVMTDK